MTNSQPHLNGPTKPQIKLLRERVEETGGTFVYPASAAAARNRSKTRRAGGRPAVPTVGARPCHRPEECQLALAGRRRARSAQHL